MMGSADEEVKSCSGKGGTFHLNELVLAKYQDRLYEAKILQINNHTGSRSGWILKVHYRNWPKSFDEWLPIDQLVKDNEANRKIKEDRDKLDKIQMAMEKERKKKASRESKPNTGTRGRKPKVDIPTSSSKEEEEEVPMKIDTPTPSSSEKMPVKINMPPSLMKQLVDDYERIAKSGKLLKLPRDPNVNLVLSKYQEYKVKKESRLTDTIAETIDELRAYFDKALPLVLLYNSERQQYKKDIAHNALKPSAIYGAEHLLRLFLKLPELLDNAAIEDEEKVAEFQEIMADFLKFLQSNQVCFFRG